jgi:hypothetical protein
MARGLRFAKKGQGKKALEAFEEALPALNDNLDLLYSIVQVSKAVWDARRTLLYGQAYIYLEDPSNSESIQEIQEMVAEAKGLLEKRKLTASKVTLEVEPKGTEVEIEGVIVGRSGRHSVWLAPGTYKARAKQTDHHPWEGTFTVQEGAPAVVMGKLRPMVFHGFLRIQTTPSEGVQVFIDDQPVGVSPIAEPIRLETRRYLVRFEKEGFDRWIRYVDIPRNDTYELKPKMERTPPGGAAP